MLILKSCSVLSVTIVLLRIFLTRWDYIELDGENAIFEVTIPQSWMGKTVGQLDIRKKFNINILGTKCGSRLDSFITPDTLLCEGKSLMVMGKYKDIQKCFRI